MPRTIRFHLDENVPHAVAYGLRRLGIDVTTSTGKKGNFHAQLATVSALSTEVLEKYGEIIEENARVEPKPVPTEVVLACHLAMGLGTLFGGWRIVKTMGQKLVKLRPVDGFCAETAAAGTLLMTIYGDVPVSTTHTISGAIVGVGSARYRFNAVRWGVAGQVVWAWVLTIPGAAAISAASWLILDWLF